MACTPKDFTGTKFGKLTAISLSHRDERGRWIWVCQCSCEKKTQILVGAYNIPRNGVTNCGCEPKSLKNVKDLTGQRFGKLTVLGPGGHVEHKDRRLWVWLCRCQCDETTTRETVVTTQNLPRTNSCGCGHWRIHGATKNGKVIKGSTFSSWIAMIARCRVKSGKIYKYYGARGITVCERWETSYLNFLADMGERPQGKTLDRYPDVNGNYEPGNCRWATPAQQNHNRRNSRLVTAFGQTKPLVIWAREIGVHHVAIWNRIYRSGWTPEQAVSTPRTPQNERSRARRS